MCMVCSIEGLDGKVHFYLILPNYAYVLPDGSLASATPAAAWCDFCHSFVPAEFIPTAEELDRWINEASIPPYSDRVQFIINGDETARKRLLEGNRKEKEWLALRSTAPKCLECGSEHFQYIPTDHSVFSHPEDGRRLTAKEAFGTTSIDNVWYLLDIEGRRIGETTRCDQDE